MRKKIVIIFGVVTLLFTTLGIFYIKFFPNIKMERERNAKTQYINSHEYQKNIEYLEKLSKLVYDYTQQNGKTPEGNYSEIYNSMERDEDIYHISYGVLTNKYYYIRSVGHNSIDDEGKKDDIEVTHIDDNFIIGEDAISQQLMHRSTGAAMQFHLRDVKW